MKNLLLGSMALLIFSICVVLVQISCSKTVAQTLAPVIKQNIIVYTRQEPLPPPQGVSDMEIWIANYDGTGKTKINVALPPGVQMAKDAFNFVRLSPDAQTIFFHVLNGSKHMIYSCDLNGLNVKQVIADPNANIILGGAY